MSRKDRIPLSKAFSLMELMIVLVIIGILATVAIVNLSGPKEQALDKEARANLKLIAAAEKIYRMETGAYVGAANETQINERLRLMLPYREDAKNWNYSVTSISGNVFNASAERTKGDSRKFYIDESPQ